MTVISQLTAAATAQGADLLGVDLARTDTGDPVEGLGQLSLAGGRAVAVADIAERLRTEKGSLFYDVDFGSNLGNWVEAPDTPAHRDEMVLDLVIAVEEDPRVKPGTAFGRVVSWVDQPREITLSTGWDWIDGTHASNLVVTIDETGVRLVVMSFNDGSQEGSDQA